MEFLSLCSIYIKMKSSEISPLLDFCKLWKQTNSGFYYPRVTRKFLPHHGPGDKLALTNFISKSSTVQTLINTEEPWGTRYRILLLKQMAGSVRERDCYAVRELVHIAICWMTHCLPFPSCNSSTIGPLRNDIMSGTLCRKSEEKRCGPCLSYSEKIISEMGWLCSWGSFQIYCLPMDSSSNWAVNIKTKDGSLYYQPCSPTGQDGALPAFTGLLQMTQGMGISPLVEDFSGL